MDIRKKITAALKGKWPVAEWVDKDDWGEYRCSNCREYGYICDHFCTKCGSFMWNYEHGKQYHYNCKHCGASLDGAESWSTIKPGAPQSLAYRYTCPACGKKSEHTFDDARVEITDDGFDERFLARLEATPWQS